MTESAHTAADNEIRNHTDIDNGYAWIVLMGCFVMYAFVVGSGKAYGVFYTEMVEYYSTGYGNTAWTGVIAVCLLLTLGKRAKSFHSLIGCTVMADMQWASNSPSQTVTANITGPVANLLCRRFSFRLVTFVGGVLIGLGYILSAFVSRMEFMYITFLFCGVGYGLTFAPCTTIVSLYFDKRRALANGTTVSGSGVAALTLPFLYKFLIDTYGLKGTLWINGAILCNICVSACLFRQPSLLVANYHGQEDGHIRSQNNEQLVVHKTHCQLCCGMNLKLSLFKNLLFTLNVISFVLCCFAYMGNSTLIPSYVKALGHSETYVALSVTIFGGVEVFARIIIGWFADLRLIKPKYIFAICMFIGAAISFIVPLFDTFTFMAIYSAVIAMFPGSFFSLLSAIIIDIVGLKAFPAAFGLVTFCLAFGGTISQPSLGWIKDYFGNWHPAFMLTGGAFLTAGVIILTEPIVIRLTKNRIKQITAETRM